MRKSLLASVFLVGALTVLVAAGEDRKSKAPADKADPKPADKADKAPAFDVADFLKDYDTNKDGSLSKDELPERYRHNFARMDTNKDGKLSKAELEKGYFYLQQRRRPSDVVTVLVEMSDCDECCAEELQEIFNVLRKLDKNNDGKFDADEIKAGREALQKARVERIMTALDANKDGKISKEEAKGMLRKNFAELDTNKDGFVDNKELTTAVEEKPKKVTPKPPVKDKE